MVSKDIHYRKRSRKKTITSVKITTNLAVANRSRVSQLRTQSNDSKQVTEMTFKGHSRSPEISCFEAASYYCSTVTVFLPTRFRDFLKKLSSLELWCPLTMYRKWAFQRIHYWTPKIPRWQRSTVLKVDMTSFSSAEGGPIWIKFRRLVQNDMSTAVICGNRDQK